MASAPVTGWIAISLSFRLRRYVCLPPPPPPPPKKNLGTSYLFPAKIFHTKVGLCFVYAHTCRYMYDYVIPLDFAPFPDAIG